MNFRWSVPVVLIGFLSVGFAAGMAEDRAGVQTPVRRPSLGPVKDLPRLLDDPANWVVQMEEKPSSVRKPDVIFSEGQLEVYAPDRGCTVWLKRRLRGSVHISYEVLCPSARLDPPSVMMRDVNCFWMASDPDSPDGIFDPQRYTGKFSSYSKLRGYYASTGGGGLTDNNRTVRFRRYPREQQGQSVEHIALIDKDGIEDYLLKPDSWMRIELVADGGTVRYSVNGRTVYELRYGDRVPLFIGDRQVGVIPCGPERFPSYQDGFFGFRLVNTHHIYRNFEVRTSEQPKEKWRGTE